MKLHILLRIKQHLKDQQLLHNSTLPVGLGNHHDDGACDAELQHMRKHTAQVADRYRTSHAVMQPAGFHSDPQAENGYLDLPLP